MPLHKPAGLHRYPRLGGDNPANTTNIATPAEPSWKSTITPGMLIEHEIAGVRKRLSDIERIQRDGVDQEGRPLNAKIRSTWHQGTRRKIKQVLGLIERFSGDKKVFIEELKELERSGLGGNVLTGNL